MSSKYGTSKWYMLSATAIKSGCVIAWKAMMTVEVAGPKEAGADVKQ